MNKKRLISLLSVPFFTFFLLSGCAEQKNHSELLAFNAAEIVDDQDSDEFTKTEYFNRRKERVKFFLGEFKDFPDPVFDPNAELKIPNQEDVEMLFKYMRKNLDSLELEGPNPEVLKSNLFMNEAGKIDFNKLLEKFRFKPVFKDLSFSIEHLTYNRAKGVPGFKPIRYTTMFKNLIMNNILFDSVKLDDVDMTGSELTKVTVANSSYNRALCMRCKFDNVYFDNDTAKDADFSFSSGTLTFDNNNISFLKITDSNFDKLVFEGGTLRNSVFINTKNLEISNTVKTFNNVSDASTPESLPLKSVGLVFEDSFPGGTGTKVLNKIRESDYQPIKIEFALEKFIDEEALVKEVDAVQKKALELKDDNSLAKRIITLFRQERANYPQIARIETMARGYVNKLDSLIIPGGLDIEPYFYDRNMTAEKFYGDQKTRLKAKKNIEAEEFPIRSILEIFLLDLAIEKQIPLLLICRGAHIYNIYKGGKMIENLPDLYDDVNFDSHLRHLVKPANLSEEDGNHKLIKLANKQGRRPIGVYGNHHQAIDTESLPSDLRILLVWDLGKRGQIPYALYDRTYAPGVWLTQFHPEVKEEFGAAMARQLSNLNTEIFDSFFELMKRRTVKQKPVTLDAPPPPPTPININP